MADVNLGERLAEARAEVARLERQAATASCAEVGHRLVFIGCSPCSCNADRLRDCSIPVHECSVCGVCDYGENADAEVERERCRMESA